MKTLKEHYLVSHALSLVIFSAGVVLFLANLDNVTIAIIGYAVMSIGAISGCFTAELCERAPVGGTRKVK